MPAGAASTSSGSPISVLKFARDAATVRCGAISAAIIEETPPSATILSAFSLLTAAWTRSSVLSPNSK